MRSPRLILSSVALITAALVQAQNAAAPAAPAPSATKTPAPVAAKAAAPAAAQPAFVVPNPPSGQMLVPGFTVRELPLELTNLTSIKYRADGKCYAVGYNGKIWLLADTAGAG